MELQIKDIISIIGIFVIPCIIWVWRLATDIKLLRRDMDSMPTHTTVHNIEKDLLEIKGELKASHHKLNGNINTLASEITNIKDNIDTIAQAFNRLEDTKK